MPVNEGGRQRGIGRAEGSQAGNDPRGRGHARGMHADDELYTVGLSQSEMSSVCRHFLRLKALNIDSR